MTKKKDIKEESQGQTSEMPERRKISPKQLEEILKQHKKWLETKGKEGKRIVLFMADLHKKFFILANLQEAKLEGTDFKGAILTNANLQKADLKNSDLREADLVNANLQETDLLKAKLQKAYLYRTILRGANLQNADLSDVIGLMGDQLAGANVSGARLPEDIQEFESLKIVAEASKNARKLFFGMLLGCVYSWLTIATTTDARLLTNSASSPLPIIGTEIPIVWFFLIAPLILLSVYLYSHIYMQRLWEGLAKLPAVFPDGRALHERAYPWLLTGLVCAHFKLLKPKRPALSRIQVLLSIILAWWVIPVTLFLFWARYLPRHEPGGTALHAIMVVISVSAAIFLYRLAVSTLRGDEREPFLWREALKDSRMYKRFAVTLGIVAVSIGFYLFSLTAINSNPISEKWVPHVMKLIGIRAYADFYEADVSEKPINWSGTANEDELRLVKGAYLVESNLKFVWAHHAFLVNADLRFANLQGSLLLDADLQNANLQRANLLDANLQNADLENANLQGADLENANLQNADLQGALLLYADLQNANLQEANLASANLKGANLQLVRLQRARLWYANLQGADLSSANLQRADLSSANLQGVRLQYADLLDVLNLTDEQLSTIKTLYKAKLDPELMEQVKKKYPHLLEKPKTEEKEKKG